MSEVPSTRTYAIRQHPRGQYRINIAAGLWKPKKHQAAAAQAIKLWADVRWRQPNLWLKHVKGHSNHRWNERADRLADAGRAGRHAYDTVVD